MKLNCPICNGKNTKKKLETKDKYIDKTKVFLFYYCKDCKLIFLDKHIQEKKDIGIIDKEYWNKISKLESNKYIKTLKLVLFKLINYKMIGLVKKHALKDCNILDIGSGNGQMSGYLNNCGYNIIGVEPDINAYKLAVSNYPTIKFYDQTLKKCNFSDNKFDIIIMTHVLEHIENIDDFLKECYRILKKNGKFIVEVPAFSTIQFKLFKGRYFNLYPPKHYYLFSPYSIKKIFKMSGFKTEKIINFSLRSNSPCLMCSLFPFFNPVEIGKLSFLKKIILSFSAYIISFILIPVVWFESLFNSSSAFYGVFSSKK